MRCQTRGVSGAWRIEERRESAGELHGSWPTITSSPGVRAVAVCHPSGPALVLGSTQSSAVVDEVASSAAGLDVVRRRSGGGAVLVTPDDPVWIDVWVPAGDPLWESDVTMAFHWLGVAWGAALEGMGVAGVEVQFGPGSPNEWSSLVCFGGVGAGEVTAGGRKVVGLSQRRNRSGSWFSGACVLRWDPTPLLGVVNIAEEDSGSAYRWLSGAVAGVADAKATSKTQRAKKVREERAREGPAPH